MDEQNQYETICRGRFDQIIERLDMLNNRLYVDNGGKSIVSRIIHNETWCNVIKWLTITFAASVIVSAVGIFSYLVKIKLSAG